ncbi:class I SAM-dependent methyltransferase [Mangrovimonas spongiae]|uniref:Class I SAM-dependent methyltransferase n=1 Tax=Mangrovimonas spongiae TaxID=2494697 RepID=A0A3R9M6S8_9FLAO|nr:class I SAM-dependent methyltransferase [Mangrovimonas spongiae]RSK38570.1 class I SAM-dependent methyltransferase [Mangrovimonas spongiae]
MNKAILNTSVQEFINTHLNTNITDLVLKGSPFNNLDTKELIEQIEAKKRCKNKLPTWFHTENIIYPNKLNIEQTSSEVTAKYKAELISGESLIDITGGFGVDDYYFSKHVNHVTHCEINDTLSKIVSHNFNILKANHIKTVTGDGLAYLKSSQNTYDWIYIDPSRRHHTKGKVFFLNDCLPNVPKHLNFLFNHTNQIIIKTSPLLDLSVGVSELNHIKSIHIIAVNNEVKELLWFLEKEYNQGISIKTINLTNTKHELFNFKWQDESSAQPSYSKPLNYIYEPNSSILKSGAFKLVSQKLNIFKLQQHAHLYTSNSLINFPGRCFKIRYTLPYNKKALKKENITKANITTRNFPESVQQIRKKFNIKDGGELYLFFTTNINDERIVVICEKTEITKH